MRVLFLPLITRGAAIGTITRCLAVAEHLRSLGHESLFLTNGEGAKHVEESGFPFVQGIEPAPTRTPHPMVDLSDVAVFLNLSDEAYLRRALEAEHKAVDDFKPDAIFSEFKLTAAITAAQAGLPLVSTACSPADPRFVSPLFPEGRSKSHETAVEGFNRILKERDLHPVDDVAELFFSRSTLKIAPTIRPLEPLLEDVPDLHYVGYLLYDRWELAELPTELLPESHAPNIVFCYFSTGEIGPSQYVKVIPQAFHNTEFHAVVAVGHHPGLPNLPENTANTTWVRFVPGRSILKRSRAVIFHGGQNTAMAALLHKVPSLIVPGKDFERDFNARGVARLGAGIHLPSEEFNPSRVLEATRELLSPRFRKAAETMSGKVLASGGPGYAAELLVRVASARQAD